MLPGIKITSSIKIEYQEPDKPDIYAGSMGNVRCPDLSSHYFSFPCGSAFSHNLPRAGAARSDHVIIARSQKRTRPHVGVVHRTNDARSTKPTFPVGQFRAFCTSSRDVERGDWFRTDSFLRGARCNRSSLLHFTNRDIDKRFIVAGSPFDI